VGFNNPKIFARYFSEMFGEKPSAFVQRLKEQKDTASAPSDDGSDDGSQPS
jgi:AraC-like DNA-binding protein